MIEKISTLISQIDWHVFAFLACFAIVAIFFAVSFLGGGKKLLESFNTKELLAALNRSEQDFDEEKERKVIDVLSIRQQRYVEALSSGRFNPRQFFVHFVAHVCIKNYRERKNVMARGYVPHDDKELIQLFDLIGQRIASYEEYSHMIEALKQLVGDMEKVSFIAHDLNPRLIYFMETKEKESPLLNEVIQLLKHSIISAIQFRLKDETQISEAYGVIFESDKLYCDSIFNASLTERLSKQPKYHVKHEETEDIPLGV